MEEILVPISTMQVAGKVPLIDISMTIFWKFCDFWNDRIFLLTLVNLFRPELRPTIHKYGWNYIQFFRIKIPGEILNIDNQFGHKIQIC